MPSPAPSSEGRNPQFRLRPSGEGAFGESEHATGRKTALELRTSPASASASDPALADLGPTPAPTPGPGPGQTAYVFTAVGTPAPAAEQKLPLNVTWVNLTTGRSGSATLTPNPEINPEGPTTLTAIVDTGSGSIMSTIFGQVTTTDKQCTFMPTIGSSVVP